MYYGSGVFTKNLLWFGSVCYLNAVVSGDPQCLRRWNQRYRSAVFTSNLSPSSFWPALTSTMTLQQQNVFCPPRPVENTVDTTLVSGNVFQVSSPSRVETAEEHVEDCMEV